MSEKETNEEKVLNEEPEIIDESETASPETENTEPSENDVLKNEIEDLKKQVSDINDKYLRTLAEYENFRKRSQKEKDQTYGNAVSDTVTKFLDILDAFDRAANYECSDAEYKKGIDLISNSVKETFSAIGVKEIPALGEQFNPDLHNAMLHIDNDAYGENEITEVYKKGYTYGDKVIRYSSVIVAN